MIGNGNRNLDCVESVPLYSVLMADEHVIEVVDCWLWGWGIGDVIKWVAGEMGQYGRTVSKNDDVLITAVEEVDRLDGLVYADGVLLGESGEIVDGDGVEVVSLDDEESWHSVEGYFFGGVSSGGVVGSNGLPEVPGSLIYYSDVSVLVPDEE